MSTSNCSLRGALKCAAHCTMTTAPSDPVPSDHHPNDHFSLESNAPLPALFDCLERPITFCNIHLLVQSRCLLDSDNSPQRGRGWNTVLSSLDHPLPGIRPPAGAPSLGRRIPFCVGNLSSQLQGRGTRETKGTGGLAPICEDYLWPSLTGKGEHPQIHRC